MKDKVKYECPDCGCYFWVENRNNFECCKELKKLSDDEILYGTSMAYIEKNKLKRIQPFSKEYEEIREKSNNR